MMNSLSTTLVCFLLVSTAAALNNGNGFNMNGPNGNFMIGLDGNMGFNGGNSNFNGLNGNNWNNMNNFNRNMNNFNRNLNNFNRNMNNMNRNFNNFNRNLNMNNGLNNFNRMNGLNGNTGFVGVPMNGIPIGGMVAAGNGGVAFGSAVGGPNGGFGFGAGLGGNGRMMVVNGGFNGRNMGGRKMGKRYRRAAMYNGGFNNMNMGFNNFGRNGFNMGFNNFNRNGFNMGNNGMFGGNNNGARMKDAAPWISSMMYNFPQTGYIHHMPYQSRAMTSQTMTADDQSMTRSVGVAGSSSVTVNQDDSGSHVTSTSGGGKAVTSKGDDASSQMISNDNSFANARQMTVTADDVRNQMMSNGFGNVQNIANGYMYGLGQSRQMSLTADDLSRRMVARGFANMAEGQMTVAGDDAISHAASRAYYTMPDNTNMMFVGQGDNSNHVVSNENGIQEGQMMIAMHDDRSAVMVTDGSNTAEGSVIMTKGDDVINRVQNGHMMRQADDSSLMGAGGYSNVGEGQYYATGVETSGNMAVNDYSVMPEGNMLMTTVRDDSSRMMSGVYHQSLESPSMVVKGDDTMIVYRVD